MIRKLTAKGYSEGDWACPTHPIMSKHVNSEVEYNNALSAWMDDKQVTSVLVDDGTAVVELHREWKAIQVGDKNDQDTSVRATENGRESVREGNRPGRAVSLGPLAVEQGADVQVVPEAVSPDAQAPSAEVASKAVTVYIPCGLHEKYLPGCHECRREEGTVSPTQTARQLAEWAVQHIDDNYERFIPADGSPFLESQYDVWRAGLIETLLLRKLEEGRD